MTEEHQSQAPELEAPSLGQGPPAPKSTVHHLIANDLVIDLRDLFKVVDQKVKEAALEPPPPAQSPSRAKPSLAEPSRTAPCLDGP
jgi:hypothetical protein